MHAKLKKTFLLLFANASGEATHWRSGFADLRLLANVTV